MSNIIEPTEAQLECLVAKNIPAIGDGIPIGVAIGYVGPTFAQIYLQGSLLNQSGQPLSFDANTTFEIASVTKSFNATLYQYFVANNAIPSDATLGTYYSGSTSGPSARVPENTAVGSNYVDIPLKTLANYTSGLPQDNEGKFVDWPVPLPAPYTIPDMFSYLSGNPFQPSRFGKAYTYSNLGFGLLAQTIATSQGDLYQKLQQKYLLATCGLEQTQMYWTLGAAALENLPLGYTSQDSGATSTSPGSPFFPAWGGAGGLVSTPNDMLTWLQFNMGCTADNPLNGLLATLQSPSTKVRAKPIWDSQLGLAWLISKISNGHGHHIHTVWKDGALGGFSSLVSFLQSPSPGTTPSLAGVFVLTNSNGNAVYNIANDLLFIMSGRPPSEDKSVYPRVHGK